MSNINVSKTSTIYSQSSRGLKIILIAVYIVWLIKYAAQILWGLKICFLMWWNMLKYEFTSISYQLRPKKLKKKFKNSHLRSIYVFMESILLYFLIGVELLYSVVFASAIQQCESALSIPLSPSSWVSLPPPSPLSAPLLWR